MHESHLAQPNSNTKHYRRADAVKPNNNPTLSPCRKASSRLPPHLGWETPAHFRCYPRRLRSYYGLPGLSSGNPQRRNRGDAQGMDETKNPWTVLSKETPYENEWIRVDHHEVLKPSGGAGIYGVVHFKGHALGIIPIDERGNTILVGQYRFPLGYYSWEIPQGGGLAPTPLIESAQRELREECGVAAKQWLQVLGMDLSNSVTDEQGTAFLAWDLTEGAAEPEDTEQLQVVRVPFWEAFERAKRGEIRDSVSVAALFRIALMALQGDLPQPVAGLLRR